MRTAFPIEGFIQEYAWGGYDFLRQLTDQQTGENASPTPWAELWLGAHPKGPAVTAMGDLGSLIDEQPEALLGTVEAKRWKSQLPFLLKVLDVREMLSIQTHPNKAAAEIGFLLEETKGLDRSAADRNYRDRNHKPELGVALTDFYLLHGFRSAAAIKKTLAEVPGWASLLGSLEEAGVEQLYSRIMAAEQHYINTLLEPLKKALAARGELPKSDPAHWARKAFASYSHGDNHDRGIFSIYWFNLVYLGPGEGIFQSAGIPHAYLEGACVELMANSDNVLRGGLTAKHIDVPELLRQLSFGAVTPEIIRPELSSDGWSHYATPAPDFHLATRLLSEQEELIDEIPQTAIYLVFSGAIELAGKRVGQGQAIFKPGETKVRLRSLSPDTLIYRASAKSEKD